MRIAFFTRGPKAKGSTRVRVLQYAKALEKRGYEIRVLPRPRQGLLRHVRYIFQAARMANWADVLFLQKPNQSRLLIELLHSLNRRVIVDIDDAVWSSSASKSGHRMARISKKFKNRLIHAVKRSSFVITGSHYLSDVIKEFCPAARIAVLPSSVDLERFNGAVHVQRNEPITIGWIGSSSNLSDLLTIDQALRSVCSLKNTRLLIVSSHPPKLNGISFEFQNWAIDKEVESLSEFDIGIMPLRDDERSRGRCGYKAIQYMAAGIPVVSSPVGAGREIVEQGVTGFYASTPEEWETHLSTLAKSSELRRTMGTKGRERAAKLYSTQSNLPRLVEILTSVANRAQNTR